MTIVIADTETSNGRPAEHLSAEVSEIVRMFAAPLGDPEVPRAFAWTMLEQLERELEIVRLARHSAAASEIEIDEAITVARCRCAAIRKLGRLLTDGRVVLAGPST